MGIFNYNKIKKIFKRKSGKSAKESGFYELDDTLYNLFTESEKTGKNLLEIFEVTNKLFINAENNNLGEDKKLYASGILNYIDFLINGEEDTLNTAIDKLSRLVEKKEISVPHAHYFLGKAYYKKSFSSSDPLKYQSLSTFHLTEAEKGLKGEKNETKNEKSE